MQAKLLPPLPTKQHTSFSDVRLLEETKTTAIPVFMLEIFFTSGFPHLLCILQDWEELFVVDADIFSLVTGVKTADTFCNLEGLGSGRAIGGPNCSTG